MDIDEKAFNLKIAKGLLRDHRGTILFLKHVRKLSDVDILEFLLPTSASGKS